MSRGEGKYRKWRECERKERFADEHVANHRAEEYGLRAYHCDYCDGYHLTHLSLSQAPTPPRRPHGYRTPLQIAEAKLDEAEQILAQLQAMKRASKQVPPKALVDAQTAVENARRERDEVRSGGKR